MTGVAVGFDAWDLSSSSSRAQYGSFAVDVVEGAIDCFGWVVRTLRDMLKPKFERAGILLLALLVVGNCLCVKMSFRDNRCL